MSEKSNQEKIEELTELVDTLKKCLVGDRGLRHIVPYSNLDFWDRGLAFILEAEKKQKDNIYQKYIDLGTMIRLMDKYLINTDYDLAIKNEVFFEERAKRLDSP